MLSIWLPVFVGIIVVEILAFATLFIIGPAIESVSYGYANGAEYMAFFIAIIIVFCLFFAYAVLVTFLMLKAQIGALYISIHNQTQPAFTNNAFVTMPIQNDTNQL